MEFMMSDDSAKNTYGDLAQGKYFLSALANKTPARKEQWTS